MMTALATGSTSSFQERKRLSSLLGNDDGVVRVVGAARDRAPQRFLVRALEVPQRLRPDAPDARVAILGARRCGSCPCSRSRKLELFAEDVGELVERHVDLEDVLAGVLPRLTLPVLGLLALPTDRVADLAVALAHAAALLVAVDETWDVNLGKGDADDVLALAADELALGDVAA